MQRDAMRVLTGRGGWGWARVPELPGVDIYFRVANSGERLAIVDLRIAHEAEAPLDASTFRSLPIGRLEQLVNRPSARKLFAERIATDGPAVAADVAEFWPKLSASDPEEVLSRPPKAAMRITGRNLQRKPVSFYERVADLYALVAAVEDDPATVLADANDVPIDIVYRWIKEARRRGLLAPGRRG